MSEDVGTNEEASEGAGIAAEEGEIASVKAKYVAVIRMRFFMLSIALCLDQGVKQLKCVGCSSNGMSLADSMDYLPPLYILHRRIVCTVCAKR